MVELKSEQQAFLAECEQEFANRYTMEDEEFKALYDSEIPPPPVMSNWYPRNKRNQGGRGGRYRDFRDRRQDNRYNYRHEYNRNYDRSGYEDNYRGRNDHLWNNQEQDEVRDGENRDYSRNRPRYND
ncbi:RNA guanine-N7 methyltransferase activating subunit [Atheta coriaria]|uniref:RNA guanine-N7 methyltransferase activating subunit n=1 Tax=Dalotia coriaria TaxID=877792 RepID=UPI0031F4505A